MSDDRQPDDCTFFFDESLLYVRPPDEREMPMRPEHEVAAIVQTIKAIPAIEEVARRSLFWLAPATRRAVALGQRGRLGKLIELSRTLGAATGTPEWVAAWR